MKGEKRVRLDGPVAQIVSKHTLPEMYTVRQLFDTECIDDVQSAFECAATAERSFERVKPGMRIAVAAGSRGIDKYTEVIKLTVDKIKSLGAEAFIFPAMGSHGGATAKGQLAILEHYGITEESMGCPILSSMETVHVGDTPEGVPVYMDKHAYGADGIVIVNRIKAHTAIRNRIESGLVKMSAIGLGKQKGADYCHSQGFDRLAHNIEELTKVNLSTGKILFGIGLIENANDRLCKLVCLPAEDFFEKEPALLAEAKARMPRILLDECDILVVDQVGKNISGSGMDPNITGTHHTMGAAFGGIRSSRIVVLDMTDETDGNGTGMGCADITTQRAFDKFDFNMSYANPLTCSILTGVRIPIVLPNDRMALQGAMQVCTVEQRKNIRMVRISNSLKLTEIEVSEALIDEIREAPDRFEIIRGPYSLPFDENGNLF